jgi:pullulanase/glycogen debranching enzyme
MKTISLTPKWTFEIMPGSPMQLGATIVPEGINFAVFSRHAAHLWLVLFTPTGSSIGEIELDPVRHLAHPALHKAT